MIAIANDCSDIKVKWGMLWDLRFQTVRPYSTRKPSALLHLLANNILLFRFSTSQIPTLYIAATTILRCNILSYKCLTAHRIERANSPNNCVSAIRKAY